MNVYDFLMQNTNPEKFAIQSRDEEITYAELVAIVDNVVIRLHEIGVLPQDQVAILADNSSFWVATYLGILRYGAVAVPVPVDRHPATIMDFLRIIDCKAYCVDASHFKKFPDLPENLLVTEAHIAQSTSSGDITTYPAKGTDLAALMFTSGSTGNPNAVKVMHKNIVTNTRSIVEYLQLDASDKIMAILPFHYCFGTSLLHTHLHIGGTVVINNQFLYTETILDDMENFECTGFAGVPTVYQRLMKRSTFTKREFKHLRHMQQAGGRLSPTIIEDVVKAHPDKRFYVMYGQTEATARLTYLPPDMTLKKPNSIGIGIPYTDVQVLNDAGNPVAVGEEGEIVATGDNITAGYWQNVDNQRYIDGKLHTGDIATIDEDGYIYIVGRKSDFLKPNGRRISTQTIVDALLLHPDVIEAEVVGIDVPDMGEMVRAFVGVGERTLSENEIKRHCIAELPRFAIPHEIIILPALPKNESGKIQKSQLRNWQVEQ